eukprot:gene5754-6338_t
MKASKIERLLYALALLLFCGALLMIFHVEDKPTLPPAELPPCDDDKWCSIDMPTESLFRFDPPNNATLWRVAQLKALTGEPILLEKVLEVLTHPMDFLVGDINFREYFGKADYFMDDRHDFSFVFSNNSRVLAVPHKADLPPFFSPQGRTPIISTDYPLIEKRSGLGSSPYFNGKINQLVMNHMFKLLPQWQQQHKQIVKPFILLSSSNENWGILSTYFPNRTANWGLCCSENIRQTLMQMLDHEKTVLFLTNQHHNFTHPKLLSLPRGLNVHRENQRKFFWDTMLRGRNARKDLMIFTASSSWGPRPLLRKCILERIASPDVLMEQYGGQTKRVGELEYFIKMLRTRMSIALPGLGYDTFRLWESMTLGVVPVLEKGVGFDKPLWKLPALLVEDFSMLTPQLLRTAYIEAIYRVLRGDFELQRLTQSFWWSFIFNVSSASNPSAVIEDHFPSKAEDAGFTRPAQPFNCEVEVDAGGGRKKKQWACGRGTKRTPRSSC